ncbi:MAG: radical SAM protein [Peptococcaceae bacterium]|nr:radical SAM protein [Peptococcaceae bacterium]
MPVSLSQHPCFGEKAHSRYGRIHLAVAPKCNLRCGYCDRKYDCPNESRPGVASRIISPEEAVLATGRALKGEPRLRVAGIAGPGEPLANPETFETLALLRRAFPQLMLCVSTNGLLLPEALERLHSLGLGALTVTVNTLRPQTAARIYGEAEELLPGEGGLSGFLARQRQGIAAAAGLGIAVKINTVLIPGVNEEETEEIAGLAAELGASIMNIMPLIPQGAFGSLPRPSRELLAACRRRAGRFLPQLTCCVQCRADACGVPGEDLGKAWSAGDRPCREAYP